jgi:ribokinase
MASERKSQICNVGACFTDLIAYVPRMPGPGETLPGSKFSTGFGGKGANQAVQAARLGAKVMMVSKLGQDTFGQDTLKNFEDQGVDAKHVQLVPGMSSGVAPITVDEGTAQNAIVIIPGALDKLCAADVEAARADIRGCKLMMVQLEAPLESTKKALEVAKEEGVMTLLNTAPAKPLPDDIWPLCDIVCPNEPELQTLTGKPTSTDDEVKEAVNVLLQKGARKVLVTLGSRGCGLFEEGKEPVFVAAEKVQAKDTTGAGDSFLGAFSAHMVAQEGATLDFEAAMRQGNRVAAISVTREGTQKSFPNSEELSKM